jgi:hypothetical protein
MTELNDGATGPAASSTNPITDIKVMAISYATDHRVLLDKRDTWHDPISAAERDWIANQKPEYRRGENGDKALPISHTWGERIGIWVKIRVEPSDAEPESGTLMGQSSRPEVSFQSPQWTFPGGESWVLAYADAALPAKIDLIEDVTVTWKAVTNIKTHSPCGESKHEIYVTAGRPKLAKGWPMTDNLGNHNWVTAFRMKHAVKTAKGQSKGHDIVQKIWDSYGSEYDLMANGAMNPWNLSVAETTAQCMTICAFIESAAGMLGIVGRLVYCWPSFVENPGADPEVTKSFNPGTPGVWALASPTFHPQSRLVTSPPHSGHQQHSKYGPSETVAMVDHHGSTARWTPGWNNYEATFRYTENGVTKYYGGGGSVQDTPSKVLDDVCAVISWCYSTAEGHGRSFCNPPGPCRWWSHFHRTPWPPPTTESPLPG